MILDRPPVNEGLDTEKSEHQQVVVDFRLSEGVPNDTRHYVIQRDKSGSYEVLSTGLIEDDKVIKWVGQLVAMVWQKLI